MSFTKTTLIGNFIKTIVKTPAVDNDISYDSITLHPPPSDGDGKSIEKIYYIYIYIYIYIKKSLDAHLRWFLSCAQKD